MPTRRWTHAVAVVKGKAYSIGGYDGDAALDVVEEYDLTTNLDTIPVGTSKDYVISYDFAPVAGSSVSFQGNLDSIVADMSGHLSNQFSVHGDPFGPNITLLQPTPTETSPPTITPTATTTPTITPTGMATATPTTKPEDINRDGHIDHQDLLLLQREWKQGWRD